MAGLLGQGFDDPRSAAIMALSGGLLQGNLGAGLMGANQAFAQHGDQQLRRGLLQAQIAETNAQAEERKNKLLLAQKAQERQDLFLNGDPNGLPPGAFAPSAGGMGPVAPQGAAPQSGGLIAQARAMGIPEKAIQADVVFNGGKGIPDMLFKRGTPDMQVSGAVAYDKNTIKPGFMPFLNTSQSGQTSMGRIGPDGLPVVSAPRGAMETYQSYRSADEGAKAGFDLVQVAQPDGSTKFVPRAAVVAASQPPAFPPSGGPRIMPDEQRGRDAESIRMIQSELNNPNMPSDQRAGLTRELQRLTTAQAQPGFPTPTLGVQATPTAAQKLSTEAGGKINESWLKTRYEPTVAAGDTARDLIDTVQVTRSAMENLGGTGWGTQAKAAGAAVLSGLGIAPTNAQKFAANAELFQKTAMERLWTTLNEAKGPQTEGDAARASKTYASLSNTPQANSFILDFAQAKAARDQMKAKFYEQALPIARQKGDLSEVDREWAKRSPSIFNMPTMKQWGGGIK